MVFFVAPDVPCVKDVPDSSDHVVQCLMMRPHQDIYSPWGKFLCLGLGLLFLGKQMAIEATHEVSTLLCWLVRCAAGFAENAPLVLEPVCACMGARARVRPMSVHECVQIHPTWCKCLSWAR